LLVLQPPLLDDAAELALAPAELVTGGVGVVMVGVGVGVGVGVVMVGVGVGVVMVGVGVGVVMVGVGTGVVIVAVGTGVGGAPALAPSSPDSEPQPRNVIPVAKPRATVTKTIFFICWTSLFERLQIIRWSQHYQCPGSELLDTSL
jgi:hypothetical protein